MNIQQYFSWKTISLFICGENQLGKHGTRSIEPSLLIHGVLDLSACTEHQ